MSAQRRGPLRERYEKRYFSAARWIWRQFVSVSGQADAILDSVAEALVREQSPHAGVAVSHSRVFSNPYSIVVKLSLAEPSRTVLYIKKTLSPPHRTAVVSRRIRTEFAILNTLWNAFSKDDALAVVRPIICLPDEQILVTEECPGPTMQALIGERGKWYSFSRDGSALRDHCRQAGYWLARFHTITRQDDAEFDFQSLRDYCEERMAGLHACTEAHLDAGFGDLLFKSMEILVQQLRGEKQVVTGRHNDFAPHNIIISRNGICVLDFTMFDYESPFYDLCNFWVKLECLKSSPLYWHHTVSRLQQAFLDGYGGGIDCSSPLSRLVQIRFRLTRMLEAISEPASYPRKLLNRHLFNRFKQWFEMNIFVN